MPGAGELAARRLDITSRSIDLLLSLNNIASGQASITKIALEIGQWLGGEKLNRYQLQSCFEQARGLILPNSDSQNFLAQVRSGISKSAVLPLRVQPSGSLGRLLLDDPFLCWIVTTTSCLFQSHGEKYVTGAIAGFILCKRAGRVLTDRELAWHPDQILVQPVLEKIVSSVWLNVVNSGNKDMPIKEEVLQICPRGHYLDSYDFGRAISVL